MEEVIMRIIWKQKMRIFTRNKLLLYCNNELFFNRMYTTAGKL